MKELTSATCRIPRKKVSSVFLLPNQNSSARYGSHIPDDTLVEKSCKIIWKKHNVQRIFAVEFGKEHKVRDKVLQISKICRNFAVDFEKLN